MKIAKRTFLLITLAVIGIMVNFTACKKSDVGPSIFGTWNYDYRSGNYIYRMSYKFAADSSLLNTTTVLDTTKKELGYRYKMTGRYRLNGNALSLFQSNVSTLQNPPAGVVYVPEQNLTPVATIAAEIKQTLNFNDDKTSFTIVPPPCPANANCVAYTGPFIKE